MPEYARVVPPLEITPALLTSTSVAEPSSGETVWSNATNYGVDAEVVNTALHWTWRSAHQNNQSNPPPTEVGKSDTHWLSVGPTNRYRAFDLIRSTATTGPSPLTFEITPGKRINSFAALGLVADQVTVTVSVAGSPVYTLTQSLRSRVTAGWLAYYTGEFLSTPLIYRHNLPAVASAVITFEFTREAGEVSVGSLLIGSFVTLGEVEARPESDERDFSSYERDFEGNTSELIPRRSLPTIKQTVWSDDGQINKLRATRVATRTKPCLWTGLSDSSHPYADTLTILGIRTQWLIVPMEGGNVMQQLQLEEN